MFSCRRRNNRPARTITVKNLNAIMQAWNALILVIPTYILAGMARSEVLDSFRRSFDSAQSKTTFQISILPVETDLP